MAKKNDIVKAEAAAIQSVEQIENLILTIRGKQVILDRDLARLYGVETRVTNCDIQFYKDGCSQVALRLHRKRHCYAK